jgi:hypothetical protein
MVDIVNEVITEPAPPAAIAVERTNCRGCQARAWTPLFSLGNLALCNQFTVPGEEAVRAPLDLLLCDPIHGGCGLVQLRHTTRSDLMYTEYWAKSGVSGTMRRHLAELVARAEEVAGVKPGDVVLDIGCNDGTTLRAYRTPGITRVGFEPNQLREEAREGTTLVIPELFNAGAFASAFGRTRAQVITSLAMFYDVDDPCTFIEGVRACLAPEGVWIIEMHYLPAMLAANGFDAIVHEHVTYYSLQVLTALLGRHGMEVFDLELNAMNGGSFRVYVRHARAAVGHSAAASLRVRRRERAEEARGMRQAAVYGRFWRRITRLKQQAQDAIGAAADSGRRVLVYGASTKGNALLQFFELDHRLIALAGDINREKWGRRTPGTGIPIVSPEELARARPDYLLVLIWHLLAEVRQQWDGYLADGGRLLVPLPRFRVDEAVLAAARRAAP